MKKMLVILLSISFGVYIKYGDTDNVSSYLVPLILPFFLTSFCRMSSFEKTNVLEVGFFFTLSSFLCYSIANNFLNGLSPLSGVFWWCIFITMFTTKINRDEVTLSAQIFTVTSIIVLSIDAYFRFFVSTINLEYGFYAYKYGLIGVDSNFAGFFAMLVAITYDQVVIKCKRYWGGHLIIISIVVLLLLSTFSRAAIIGLVFYIFLYRVSSKYKFILGLVTLIISMVSVYELERLAFNGDESGGSKIKLIADYTAYFFNSSWELILFGYGLGGLKVGDFNPHLLPLQLLIGYGLVGFFLYYSFIVFMLLRYNSTKFVIIPYLFISMSVAPIGVGILVFILYLFIRLDDDNRMLLCRQ